MEKSYVYQSDFKSHKIGQRPEFWIEPSTFDGGMNNH
jgi:hypothetical protein